MQVSNGSGQGSDYRVGSNAGGMTLTKDGSGAQASSGCTQYVVGSLQPGESQVCSTFESVYVEFRVNEKVVASAWFSQDPGQVMLVEKEGRFTIEATSEITVAA